MKKRKIKWHRLLIVILSVTTLIVGLVYAFTLNKPTNNNIASTPTVSPTTTAYVNEKWNEYKALNSDYIGDIIFAEGLLNEKFVQATDNEKYLNLSWDLVESTHGAVFMDYRNTMEDQNIILYGHYVYKDESLIFGPLHNLIKQENYEKNKFINLNLENEQRTYEIANVFYYEMDNPTLEYFHTNYDEDYFNLYFENVKNRSFYDTGVEIKYGDQFLTLQTCVRNRDDLRLIVIAKMIEA